MNTERFAAKSVYGAPMCPEHTGLLLIGRFRGRAWVADN